MTVVQLEKGVELEIIYLETGRPDSSQDKRRRDHKKLIRFSKDSINTTRKLLKLKRVFNTSSKRQILSIFAINIAGSVPHESNIHPADSIRFGFDSDSIRP